MIVYDFNEPVTHPELGKALDKLRNEALDRVDAERLAWVKAVRQLQGQITDLRANLRNAAEGLGEGLDV